MWTASLSAKWQSSAVALCVAVVSSITAGCGMTLNEAAIEKLSAISAGGNNLRVTQTMQLKTEAPVIWSVNGIPGGNSDIGTVSSTGVYTAPAIVPLPNNQVTIGVLQKSTRPREVTTFLFSIRSRSSPRLPRAPSLRAWPRSP